MEKNKVILLIIFIGMFISISMSFFNIHKFDKYEVSTDDREAHSMIKGDTLSYWYEGYNIAKELKLNINYFDTTRNSLINYLPSKIFTFYSIIFNEDLFENPNIRQVSVNDKKIFILLFQTLIYYSLLFYLFKCIKNVISSNSLIILFILLSFEPTITQWHSSFWTESIFLSLQIFLLSKIVKVEQTLLDQFLIGLTIGLMIMQRSAAIFYIIPIIFMYLFFQKQLKYKQIFTLLLSFTIVLSIVGYHNFKNGKFFIVPKQQKIALDHYVVDTIISKSKNISLKEAKLEKQKEHNKWIVENNIDLNDKIDESLYCCSHSDYYKYLDYLQTYAFKLLVNNPIETLKYVLNKTIHTAVLDPVHVFYFHSFEYKSEFSYYRSEAHISWIPIRIGYSLIFYIIFVVGFFASFKKINNKFNFYILSSFIYFLLILSWMGNTRYFTPCLVYSFIYFSLGLEYIFNKINRNINYQK